MLELNQTYHQILATLNLCERLLGAGGDPGILQQLKACSSLLTAVRNQLDDYRSQVIVNSQKVRGCPVLDTAVRDFRHSIEQLAERMQLHALKFVPRIGKARSCTVLHRRKVQLLKHGIVISSTKALCQQSSTYLQMVELEKAHLQTR